MSTNDEKLSSILQLPECKDCKLYYQVGEPYTPEGVRNGSKYFDVRFYVDYDAEKHKKTPANDKAFAKGENKVRRITRYMDKQFVKNEKFIFANIAAGEEFFAGIKSEKLVDLYETEHAANLEFINSAKANNLNRLFIKPAKEDSLISHSGTAVIHISYYNSNNEPCTKALFSQTSEQSNELRKLLEELNKPEASKKTKTPQRKNIFEKTGRIL